MRGRLGSRAGQDFALLRVVEAVAEDLGHAGGEEQHIHAGLPATLGRSRHTQEAPHPLRCQSLLCALRPGKACDGQVGITDGRVLAPFPSVSVTERNLAQN